MGDELDWEEYRNLAQAILDDLPQLPERAEDFALRIEEKLTSMIEWMEEKQHVTEPMADYIKNKRAAVDRWLENARGA